MARSLALPAAIQTKIGTPSGLRVGVVVDVSTAQQGNIGVNIAGAVLSIAYSNSYVPQLNDVVNVSYFGATWIVDGKAVTSTGSPTAGGFIDTGHNPSGPLGIGTTAVQILQSDNSRTYPASRAFRVYWRATIAAVSATSTPVQAMILQGTNGTVLRPSTTIDTQTTTIIHQFSEEWVFINNTSNDMDGEFLSITLKTSSGTLNTQATATAPLFFIVDDIGPASFYSWANSMA